MAEYIKREDALDAVLFSLVGTGHQSQASYAIRDVPTADVVEVVRCKDCKYLFDYSPDEKPFCELFADGYDHQFRPNPEDYCSRGQPRTPKERGGEK